jgi:uncharacterized protein (TIGR03084 family)
MAANPHVLLSDLADEGAALDALVAPLPVPAWATPTPAAGWTVAHQIAHLAWTDATALAAVAATRGEPSSWEALLGSIVTDLAGVVDREAARGADRPPAELLAHWREVRIQLADALAVVDPGVRIPWFGPPMKATSLATARLMETWAHGLDVADALGRPPRPTARLRHIAHLGIRTRDFAFRNRGEEPPTAPFLVELTAPDGGLHSWGPPDAGQRVTGALLDFCLLATRRRHRADLALRADGPAADRWLDIAQAFAGPPGEDPVPARQPR